MKAIYQWVLRTMMKAKGETGIVQTMPKKDLIEMNAQITAQRLMQNGVDPNSLKNADQVENVIISIENKQKANLAENIRGGIGNTKTAKVFDLKGKQIKNTDNIMGGEELPPPGSRGGPDDIAAPVQSSEETIKNMIEAENKKGIASIKNKKMIKDAVDNASPGFVKGDRKYNAQLVAEDLADKKFGKEFYDLDQRQQMDLYDEALEGLSEDFAQGGRAGFKIGSIDKARRAFLKTVGAVGGGIAALKTGLLGLTKGGGKEVVQEIVKTPPVPGKPAWFDALVTRVVNEGEDVTKKFATKEREIVHTKKLEEGKFADEVTVYRDLDDGTVRVEYNSVDNMSEAPVNLTFKPGMADEATKGKPADTFQADEIVPESRMVGPDDFEIEDAVDEFDNVVDLNSDVSKLKQFAGKKLTTKEIVEGINKRKRSRAIVEDRSEAADFMTSRQGDYDPSPDDFASGGIARMLGE